LAALALSGAAYLLIGVVVDIGVVRIPNGNRYLQTALIVLLGLAFVAAADGFLAVIRAISPSEMLGWPSVAAAAGSVAYSLIYGHRVFVNYWHYDDWGYLVPHALDKALITRPLNDHFVPLLMIVLWGVRSVFGFDYIGAACLQQAAFLLIVVVLAHMMWSVSRRPWVVVLLVGLFAMWPSYGPARTWFGGGFWLTASAALLSVYVLHARRIVFAGTMPPANVVVSFALATSAVFISSQTLTPGLYLVAFCAPGLLMPQRRNIAARRLGILCAISLVPTAVAFWGRSVYVGHVPLNFSGLFDGSLFESLATFILNKVLLVDSHSYALMIDRLPRVELYWACGLTLVAAGIKLAAARAIDARRRADFAGLILGGYTILVVQLVQIGVARRWDYDIALTPYYVTLPFLGFWLALAGTVLSLMARPRRLSKNVAPPPPVRAHGSARASKSTRAMNRRERRRILRSASQPTPAIVASDPEQNSPIAGGKPRQAPNRYRIAGSTWGAALAFTLVMVAARLADSYQPQRPPQAERVRIVQVQRQFMDSLGAAVCDLAAMHSTGPAVRWVPEYDIADCTVCKEIIGPREFVQAIGLESVGQVAARRSCPAADVTRVLAAAPVTVTDGTESGAARSFVRQYLAPVSHSAMRGRREAGGPSSTTAARSSPRSNVRF
jgi:hypothetical protein